MSGPDSLDYTEPRSSEDLLDGVQLQSRGILDAISSITIEDEVVQRVVGEAVTFIENPTEDLSDIMEHTTDVGQMCVKYMMQGDECPAEIDAMHGHLFALQCMNRIKFVEEALLREPLDSAGIQEAMRRGSDWAKTLSKGWNDDSYSNVFKELQNKLGGL